MFLKPLVSNQKMCLCQLSYFIKIYLGVNGMHPEQTFFQI